MVKEAVSNSTTYHIHCYCSSDTVGRPMCCLCGSSYQTTPPYNTVIIRVPGNGSEHLEYIRRNYEHIPDFMRHSISMVMDMAEMWIKGLSQEASRREVEGT